MLRSFICLAVGVVAMLSSGVYGKERVVKITAIQIGFPILLYAQVRLADQMGIFKKNGIKVVFVDPGKRMGPGERDILLKQKDADIALNLFTVKGDWRNEAEILYPITEGSLYMVLAKKEIGSVQDLGGKLVAAYGCGGNDGPGLSTTLFREYVKEKAPSLRFFCGKPDGTLRKDTIYIIPNVPFQTRLAYMANPSSGVYATLEFVDFASIQMNRVMGLHGLVSTADLNGGSRRIYTQFLIARKGWAQKNPELASRMVVAIKEIQAVIRSEADRTKLYIAAYKFPRAMEGAPDKKRYEALSERDRKWVDFFYEVVRGTIPVGCSAEQVKRSIRFYAYKPELPIEPGLVNQIYCTAQ